MFEQNQDEQFADKEKLERTKSLYLRGKLTPEEAVAFETYFIDKPELLEALEVDMLLQQQMPAVSFGQDINKSGSANDKWFVQYLQPLMASAATLLICIASFNWYWQGQDVTADFNGSGKVNLVYVSPVRSGVLDEQANLSLNTKDEQVTIVLQPSNTVATIFDIKMIRPNGDVVKAFNQVNVQGMGDLVIAVPMAQFNQGNWTFEIRAIGDTDDVERLRLTVTD